MAAIADRVQAVQLTDEELKLPSADILEKFVSWLEKDFGTRELAWEAWRMSDTPVPQDQQQSPSWKYSDLMLHKLSLFKGVPVVPDASARLRQVAAIVEKSPSCLAMESWHHPCRTAHCMAGWGLHLVGREMEARLINIAFGLPGLAGAMLLGHEAACYFFDVEDDSAARAFLKRQLNPV